MEVPILFLDFKQSFDNLNRRKSLDNLKNSDIANEVIRIIEMTMRNSPAKIATKKKKTRKIQVKNGVINATIRKISNLDTMNKITK